MIKDHLIIFVNPLHHLKISMKRKSLFAFLLGGALVIMALGWGFAAATASASPAATSGTASGAATVPNGSVTEQEPLYPDLGDAADTATAECTDKPDSAGLIPCGRYINDPATEWNECDKCGFCSFALSLQLILDFLLKIVGVAAFLGIILGQLLAMTAVGQTDMMVKIKSALWQGLLGYAYVVAAWVVVNAILVAIGYTDPLGGEWYTVC
jgi:hypothetical protein